MGGSMEFTRDSTTLASVSRVEYLHKTNHLREDTKCLQKLVTDVGKLCTPRISEEYGEHNSTIRPLYVYMRNIHTSSSTAMCLNCTTEIITALHN